MKSDISSLRILISCIWFFFCFLKILICFFLLFTVFLRVIVLYSCWQFWKMKKKVVGVYVQFHKFRLLKCVCLFMKFCAWISRKNCYVAMGGLLQWCCFVILFREFIAMDGVREGFWWTFSKILRYVKGSGNIFHIYLFEILCHLWGVMEMKVVAMKIVAMGNVAM